MASGVATEQHGVEEKEERERGGRQRKGERATPCKTDQVVLIGVWWCKETAPVNLPVCTTLIPPKKQKTYDCFYNHLRQTGPLPVHPCPAPCPVCSAAPVCCPPFSVACGLHASMPCSGTTCGFLLPSPGCLRNPAVRSTGTTTQSPRVAYRTCARSSALAAPPPPPPPHTRGGFALQEYHITSWPEPIPSWVARVFTMILVHKLDGHSPTPTLPPTYPLTHLPTHPPTHSPTYLEVGDDAGDLEVA